MTAALTGTRPLLTVSLHQDIRNIGPWIVLISALSATSILGYEWVFRTEAERQELVATLGANPALSLIFGPAHDLLSADGFNAWRAGQLGALFAGFMAILIVVRNSRADEDSGRAELIASGVMGRQTRLAVAVLMAAVASVALGVLCFLLTVAVGGGAAATLTIAATFTASGLMFAGVAAVAAQLGAEARTSSSLALGVLGILFVLRGYLDSSGAPQWTLWLTPFGWLERTRPAVANDPRPLLAALALAVALVLVAFVLQSRRDFGQGLISPRPGPDRGGVVTSVWGLAFRLNRGTLVAWLIALAALGATFGNLVESMSNLVAGNPAMAQVFAAGGPGSSALPLVFVATLLQIIAIVTAIMGVQVILRIHTEETELRAEALYAGALRREVYLASNVVVALTGTAIALVAAGLALGLAATGPTGVAVGTVVEQAAVTVPAVWVLVGLTVAAVGVAPRLRLIGWVGVVVTFAVTLLGPTFRLPDWALAVSPLHHVPNVSAASPEGVVPGGLLLVAAGLVAVGLLGYLRRNIG